MPEPANPGAKAASMASRALRLASGGRLADSARVSALLKRTRAASGESVKQNMWELISTAPAHVPREMARYYVYWRVLFVLGAVEHMLTFMFFYEAGVTFMAVFNLFSVALFVAIFFLLRRGWYLVSYWSAISELILHGIAATLCVGPEFGFGNYTFMVVILLFMQPFYSWRASLVLAAIILATAAGLAAYMFDHGPLYVVGGDLARTAILRQVVAWPAAVLAIVLPFIFASARAEQQLAAAHAESERLLLNVLPGPIASRLKAGSGRIADDHDRVCILFADIADFTALAGRLTSAEVVNLLSEVFGTMDRLVEKHGLEKIKTIGDSYMVAAGLPDAIEEPEERIADLALDFIEAFQTIVPPGGDRPLAIRIGIYSGRLVAGVIGARKFAYDVWGDTVNMASRMEETALPGRIQVTSAFAEGLTDRFEFEDRGLVDVRGKGQLQTSFLLGRRPAGASAGAIMTDMTDLKD